MSQRIGPGSKERVLAAVARQEADRVPLDLWTTPEAERELEAALGVHDAEAVRGALGIDVRYVFPEYAGPKLRPSAGGEREDIWGVLRKRVRAGPATYDEVVANPLAGAETVADIERFQLPNPDWYDYQSLWAQVKPVGQYAVVVAGDRLNRTSVLHAGMYLRGHERVMLDLIEKPELTYRLFERVTSFYLEVNSRIFRAARGAISIFMMGDDFGTQAGLMLSVPTWREMIAPFLRSHIELAKNEGLAVMFHSCGAIRELIPDLIALGIDILNPVQTRASGMLPRELKRDFGDRLCFHGGIDIQRTLPFATEQEVRAEVRQTISDLGSGGGCILCSTHNIQADVPVRNVLAMYDEAASWRPHWGSA